MEPLPGKQVLEFKSLDLDIYLIWSVSNKVLVYLHFCGENVNHSTGLPVVLLFSFPLSLYVFNSLLFSYLTLPSSYRLPPEQDCPLCKRLAHFGHLTNISSVNKGISYSHQQLHQHTHLVSQQESKQCLIFGLCSKFCSRNRDLQPFLFFSFPSIFFPIQHSENSCWKNKPFPRLSVFQNCWQRQSSIWPLDAQSMSFSPRGDKVRLVVSVLTLQRCGSTSSFTDPCPVFLNVP